MVARAGQRRGTPSSNSVVSVADLLARDAPWSGAPSAVAVAKRPTGVARTGPVRNDSPGARRPASRPASRSTSPSTSRPAGVMASGRAGDTRLRQFVAAAWGPQWRFVTIAAAVLFTGLMANGVMLVALHGPAHSATAQSEDGGYPTGTEDPNQASRSYDDNGIPIDSALTPMFAAPGAGNLAAANTSGVGLPLTLTSLGTSVLTSAPTATTAARSAPSVSAPVRAVSPTRSGGTGTATGSVGTGSRSSSSGGVVDTVRDTASDLGKTVDKTASGVGKTVKKTADGLGKTVGDVSDNLLGGGSSKSKSSGGNSSSSSKSSSNGGLLGGLLGK